MIFIRKKLAIILLLLAAITWGGWRIYKAKMPKLDQNTIAIVDGVAVKSSLFEERLNNLKINYQPEYAEANMTKLKKNLLGRMIVETILLKEAKKKDVTVTDKELDRYIKNLTYGYTKQELDQVLFNQFKTYDDWMEDIRKKIIIEKVMSKIILEHVKVDEAKIKEYYSSHYEGKTSKEKVKLAQIFSYSKEKLQKALEEIKAGADFNETAKKYSEAPEAKDGGVVGIISKGDGVEIFDKAFAMQEQQVSDIIQSEYGFHILKVMSHIPPASISYEEVKPLITAELARQEETGIYEKWLNKRVLNTKVLINKSLLDSIK